MQRQNATTIRAELAHGHSRITWLMDEIEAHLNGLTAVPDAADYILDEFVTYWTEFRDELREHIAEEETELFGMVRLYCGHGCDLSELQAQHARLLVQLDAFEDAMIDLLSVLPSERCAHIERLSTYAETLRKDLNKHSNDERALLRSIEDRLGDGCLST